MATKAEKCQLCKERYRSVYTVSDKIWETVTDITDGSGLFCMKCFEIMARRKGINIYWTGTVGKFAKPY